MSKLIESITLYNSLTTLQDMPIPQPNPKVSELHSELSSVVQTVFRDLGITNILTESNSRRAQACKQIKRNKTWKHLFNEQYAGINSDGIYRPWWNENICFEINPLSEKGTGLEIQVGHSYDVQLTRQKLIQKQALSVAGVIETDDNWIILGVRGGSDLPDTIMSVPAGSVQYKGSSQIHPFLSSFYAECEQELGIDAKEDIEHIQLIGRLEGGISLPNSPHYIFHAKLTISYAALLEKWNSNKHTDKNEHQKLLPIHNNGQDIIRFVLDNQVDYSEINPLKLHETSKGNYGKILPQATAALLCHVLRKNEHNTQSLIEQQFGADYAIPRFELSRK